MFSLLALLSLASYPCLNLVHVGQSCDPKSKSRCFGQGYAVCEPTGTGKAHVWKIHPCGFGTVCKPTKSSYTCDYVTKVKTLCHSCSNYGVWKNKYKKCVCHSGWYGIDCSHRK
eukprot:NODE_188_length_13518_cov_0.721142.p13 type:complete len:114 gc:universal NODE_188_length_13518_cov_0.721142:9767-10108(+)